jgi:glycine/D-amino acid oxidase-like deaminating enzyme/nitrite reductase/ring-hydroxylating ferredoxin subunit
MIFRDGATVSLWQDNIDHYIAMNAASNKTVYDVIIAGGGITGISTALLLQQAGKKCLVIEAVNLCFGTTGGTTAHLNTMLDTPYTTISKNFGKENAKLVATATSEAIDLVRSNIETYGIDCGFSEADAYLFAQDEKQEKELEEILEATKEAGVVTEYSEKIPVSVPFVRAIKASAQAKFNPVQYVYGLAAAFERAGGVILQDCRVTGVESNELVEVETGKGLFKAYDLVYATHIPPGVNLLHLRCIPYRSYAMAVSLEGNNYPQDLAYDMYDPYHYYRTQKVNGKNYFIAGGKDHKTAHEDNTEQCFLKLEAHIRKYFSVAEIAYKWSSQFFEPADGLPYIGHLPGHPEHIFAATGFGGNGMVYSSVAALTLKGLLLNEETRYSRLFDPNRIKPVAGFVNFIKHNADVVKHFAGKWFSGEDLHQLADLAPGDGRIVTYNKQKIALYKDDNANLHALNPVCTHLKCEVKWNTAEKSWDCPCHGARYSYDGKVLTGPADHDLEAIAIRSLAARS